MATLNAPKLSFGENLKGLMVLRGINDVDLAQAVGVSHTAIGNYKRGRIPKAATLHRLANFFAVQMDDLLKGDASAEKPRASQDAQREESMLATRIERTMEGHFPTFAARLKWLRETLLKLPLRTFAESVCASKTYIANLENGKRDNPSADILDAICERYRVRLDWLKNGFGLPEHHGVTLMGPNGEDFPLSGQEAPLTWLRIGKDPLGTMRLMVAQMDNLELIDKAYRVLVAEDIPQEEKISVTSLYVGALRERLLPDAPDPSRIGLSAADVATKLRRANIAREQAVTAEKEVRRAAEAEEQERKSSQKQPPVA